MCSFHTHSHQFHKFPSNYFLQRLPFFHLLHSLLTPIKYKLDLSSLRFSHIFSSLYLTVRITGYFLTSIIQLLMLSSAVSHLLFNLSTQFLISMVTLLVLQFDSFSTLPVRFSYWRVKERMLILPLSLLVSYTYLRTSGFPICGLHSVIYFTS